MRRALWASLVVLALASASCGGGTDEDSVDNPVAGTTAGQAGNGGVPGGGTGGASGVTGGSVCGDGRIDAMANELCEPTVAHNLTCEGLGMGRGLIVCSSSCQLMMMCAPPDDGDGGEGASNGGNGG